MILRFWTYKKNAPSCESAPPECFVKDVLQKNKDTAKIAMSCV